MRVTLWIVISVVAAWAALVLFLTHLPHIGGGSIPYEEYWPEGTPIVLSCSAALFATYGVFLWRRAHPNTWFVSAIASFLPLILSALPSWNDLRRAQQQELHPFEGSDVFGHIEVAKTSWLLGCILTAILLNMCVFGYFARRREV
jgi:hypothetical protein